MSLRQEDLTLKDQVRDGSPHVRVTSRAKLRSATEVANSPMTTSVDVATNSPTTFDVTASGQSLAWCLHKERSIKP